MAPVAIVDLSWVLYLFRRSYKDVARIDASGRYNPAGHVYGTIRVIQELSNQYKAVILAVDSRSKHRYELLPGYKAGRHSPTGDPYEDYPIMSDLLNILKICTFRSNVFYIKHEGLESDDIIASWLAVSAADDKKELFCYFNDADILQTPGRYHWFRSFREPETDRRGYIKGKFGLDLDYLPVWWKAVRGDRSDRIPSAVPRFPSKGLVSICSEAAIGPPKDIAWFMQKIGYPGIIDAGAIRSAVERNLGLVSPEIVPVSEFRLKRLGCSLEEVFGLLGFYQISDFVPYI